MHGSWAILNVSCVVSAKSRFGKLPGQDRCGWDKFPKIAPFSRKFAEVAVRHCKLRRRLLPWTDGLFAHCRAAGSGCAPVCCQVGVVATSNRYAVNGIPVDIPSSVIFRLAAPNYCWLRRPLRLHSEYSTLISLASPTQAVTVKLLNCAPD
jgi:hypothetical protein